MKMFRIERFHVVGLFYFIFLFPLSLNHTPYLTRINHKELLLVMFEFMFEFLRGLYRNILDCRIKVKGQLVIVIGRGASAITLR